MEFKTPEGETVGDGPLCLMLYVCLSCLDCAVFPPMSNIYSSDHVHATVFHYIFEGSFSPGDDSVMENIQLLQKQVHFTVDIYPHPSNLMFKPYSAELGLGGSGVQVDSDEHICSGRRAQLVHESLSSTQDDGYMCWLYIHQNIDYCGVLAFLPIL